MNSNERGNILFLILLAVVLFAALAYAVTSSMRGGGKNAGSEQARAGAAAISQYVALLRGEVQRLMLVNDCKIENLDWRHERWTKYNGAWTYGTVGNVPVAPPQPKAGCAVFTAMGGPVAPQTFEKYKDPDYEAYHIANNPAGFIAGHAAPRWVNRKNEGTSKNDVALFLQGINEDVCRYLLDPTGQTAIPDDAYNKNTDANGVPTGEHTAVATQIDDPANLAGDFFASSNAMGSDVYCGLGAILITQ